MGEFAAALPIPYYNIDSLVALPGTSLYTRMKREGRLTGETHTSGLPWQSNIVPKGMSADQLCRGMRSLCSNLYHPRRFEARIHPFVHAGDNDAKLPMDEQRQRRSQRFRHNTDRLMRHLADRGPEEAAMLDRLTALAGKRPDSAGRIRSFVHDYAQTRYLYDVGNFYDPWLVDV